MVLEFLATRTRCCGLPLGVVRLLALDQRLVVRAEAWEPDWPEAVEIGVAEDLTRLSSSPLCRFKTMSYLENVLLAREARRRGLQEVIARNEAGLLTDGSRTNRLPGEGRRGAHASRLSRRPARHRPRDRAGGRGGHGACPDRPATSRRRMRCSSPTPCGRSCPWRASRASGEKDAAPPALQRLREVLKQAKRA